MIEERAPLANVNDITPTIMTNEQNNLSVVFVPDISP